MSSFFVAGTDTNVGKTISSRAIIQALQSVGIQIVGYKPIACLPNDYDDFLQTEKLLDSEESSSDVLTLMRTTNENVSYKEINSYSCRDILTVLSSDESIINIEKINADLTTLTQRYQSVLVEGAFGWLTPMNKQYSFASWVMSHQMPVVLVVGIKEGCINHALLTAQAIQQSGLPLLGWIANRINPGLAHYTEVIEVLSEKIDAPLLGQIPYIHHPEEQELGHYITNIERLTYLQTEWVK
ncbi:dethiobiotin synthase [Avibacterium sp. 21-586]|uniref:dethiobiotin synthase n=1 Tax=Avibacterium sp. 21-586 TaxID=2911534 RepID=UPI0022483A0F|nr:dethiobiotin synthase [Avibacterium sp. 21-586]MCW9709687.1 dethiobiotin synthase [Avibacterium sp. 21-586]